MCELSYHSVSSLQIVSHLADGKPGTFTHYMHKTITVRFFLKKKLEEINAPPPPHPLTALFVFSYKYIASFHVKLRSIFMIQLQFDMYVA